MTFHAQRDRTEEQEDRGQRRRRREEEYEERSHLTSFELEDWTPTVPDVSCPPEKK